MLNFDELVRKSGVTDFIKDGLGLIHFLHLYKILLRTNQEIRTTKIMEFRFWEGGSAKVVINRIIKNMLMFK